MTHIAARARGPLWHEIRLLFQASLAVFVLTIVIGVLNGTDLLEPEHDTLMTHVHAGTLGWITLSLTAVILWMFTRGTTPTAQEHASARRMAWAVLGSVAAYVIAFWVGTDVAGDGIQRPIAGAVMFLAVAWVMAWMVGRLRREPLTVPRLALMLSWVSLLIGAVFGVILGLFTARGEVPGLSAETAGNLADAHPPTMVIGYLILAGVGLAEWLLRADEARISETRAGLLQVLFVFGAGVSLLIGLITDVEPLIILNAPLQLAGLGIFLVRLWPQLRPSAWRSDETLFVRMGVLGLVVSLGFLVFLVQGIASGRYDTDDDIPFTLILALDHVNFIGIATNLTFGAIASAATGISRRVLQPVIWGVNAGLAGFVVGIASDTTWPKRAFTPILGLALLAAIATFLTRMREGAPAAADR